MDVQIILPARRMDELCDGLVSLTAAIDALDAESVAHGFLGGEHGYGADWESDVFQMRPFYWGDCDCGEEERAEAFWSKNSHSADCYQTELKAREQKAGVHWQQKDRLSYPERNKIKEAIYKELCEKYALPYPAACAAHCTCGLSEKASAYFAEYGHPPTCALELPNFRHKPSGFEVRWYKYIGRDMQTAGEAPDLEEMFAECMDSLSGGTGRAPSPPVIDGEGSRDDHNYTDLPPPTTEEEEA